MAKQRGLVIEEHAYPNPAAGRYRRVSFDGEWLGSYDIVQGGFLPQGTRKVIADERDAQIKVVQRYISHHLKLCAEAARAYKELGVAES